MRRLGARTTTVLAIGIAVAACGGARPTSSPPPLENEFSAPGGDVVLPAIYAGLFVAGEKTYPGELVVSHSEATGPVTERQPGEVTCSIEDVRSIREGKVAEVRCSGLELVDQISGTFVGTATGLWRVDGDFADDVTKLQAADALLGAAPARGQVERKDTESGVDRGSATIVEPHAGGWCVLVTSWGGDEGGWQLCLKEGLGMIGGHGFFAGGQSRDAYFGDVRRL